MRRIGKTFVIFFLICTLLSSMSLSVSAATRANFNSNNYCVVRIDKSILDKKGKQYATVKLKTHSGSSSRNSGGKVIVTMYDGNGNYIWSGQKKGGDTLKLGDDHEVYNIYVSRYNEPAKKSILSQTFHTGNNFINDGKCNNWSISNAKKCSIS